MSPYSLIVLLLVMIAVVNAGQKVCPGYGFVPLPGNCESTCSVRNDDCPAGKKCCFRMEQPCGFQCIIPKDNEPKSGKCPPSSSQIDAPNWNMCDGHFCDVDSDCQGAEKCCYNLCDSKVCIPAE
jgi:hypothetical protein